MGLLLTAAQAAQKFGYRFVDLEDGLTAAQAAQKYDTYKPLVQSRVNCRIGSLEIN